MSLPQLITQTWAYYATNKRPMVWRDYPTPYYVVVSELMLQQTQVSRVQEKFPQFIATFPDFYTVSQASFEDLLSAWKGLGYNRRAKHLQEISQIIVSQYDGSLPQEPETLQTFPGIGKATAGSISCFAFNLPTVFIETNIRRVFIHHCFSRKKTVSDAKIYSRLAQTIPEVNPREWYYALMDYGTYLKSSVPNPNRRSTQYTKQSPFHGSNRQVRSFIIEALMQRPHTQKELEDRISDSRLQDNLTQLQKEGLIHKDNNLYIIAK